MWYKKSRNNDGVFILLAIIATFGFLSIVTIFLKETRLSGHKIK